MTYNVRNIIIVVRTRPLLSTYDGCYYLLNGGVGVGVGGVGVVRLLCCGGGGVCVAAEASVFDVSCMRWVMIDALRLCVQNPLVKVRSSADTN